MSAIWTPASSSEATLPSNTVPFTDVPMTISAWIRPATDMGTGGAYNIVEISQHSDDSEYWKLQCEEHGSGKGVADWIVATQTTKRISCSTDLTANVWQHVCAVERSGNDDREIYFNGTSEDTGSTLKTPNTPTRYTIGRETDDSADDSWDGALAHIAAWDVDLTVAEIVSLAAGANPMTIRPASLQSYAPCESNTHFVDWVQGLAYTLTALTVFTGEAAPVAPMPSPIVANFTPAAVGGATPKGPLGLPLHGALGGPI